MTHTPGPWIVDLHCVQRYGARSYVPILRPGNDPVPVAAVHLDVDGYGRHEGNANARLIAEAPTMLALLRNVPCPGGGWNGMSEGMRAEVKDCLAAGVCGCDYGDAVKKAEGR